MIRTAVLALGAVGLLALIMLLAACDALYRAMRQEPADIDEPPGTFDR
jgi:hypothetical protein